jgi:branched-chain amino acid transport system substrate-binding protein
MISALSHRIALAGAGVVAACALAACGSSSTNSASSGSGGSATSSTQSAGDPAQPTGSAGLQSAVARFHAYVGGKIGPASSSATPIVFGYIDDLGGVPSFPEDPVAANAAVKLINEQLGGIGGHPIKLQTCFVAGNETQGQTCAEQFLSNNAIVGVVQGSPVVGAGTFHSTIAGKKPTIIGSPNGVSDGSAKNAYAISAGIFGVHAFATYASKYLHAKTASLLFPGDDPAGQAAGQQLTQGLSAFGIKVTKAGYQSTATSMLAPAAAAGVGSTDVTIGLFPSPPTCIAGAQALKTTAGGKPVVALGACLAQPVQKQLGDFPTWTYMTVFENPGAPQLSADVAAYGAVMSHYAGPTANLGGWAQGVFGALLVAAKMGNQVGAGKLNPQTLSAALQSFQGPTPMAPPTLHWGSVPGLSAIGSTAYRAYSYKGSGKFGDATNGAWIS